MKRISNQKQIFILIFFLTICFACTQNSETEKEENKITLIDVQDDFYGLMKNNELPKANTLIDSILQQNPNDTIGLFAKSIVSYLLKQNSEFEKARKSCCGTNESSKKISNWLTYFEADSTDAILFMKAVGKVLEKDSLNGIMVLENAIANSNDDSFKLLAKYTHRQLKDTSGFILSGGIYRKTAVKTKGNEMLMNGNWIPVEGEFEVTQGILNTYYAGEVEFSKEGTFGDWRYATILNTDSIVSWAPVVIEGEVYFESEEYTKIEKETSLLDVNIDCSFEVQPVDYFGQYKIAKINKEKNECFPMLIIPFYKDEEGDEFLVMSLGVNFKVELRHFSSSDEAFVFFGDSSLGKIVEDATLAGRVYHNTIVK